MNSLSTSSTSSLAPSQFLPRRYSLDSATSTRKINMANDVVSSSNFHNLYSSSIPSHFPNTQCLSAPSKNTPRNVSRNPVIVDDPAYEDEEETSDKEDDSHLIARVFYEKFLKELDFDINFTSRIDSLAVLAEYLKSHEFKSINPIYLLLTLVLF
jgi:hypothetical protein